MKVFAFTMEDLRKRDAAPIVILFVRTPRALDIGAVLEIQLRDAGADLRASDYAHVLEVAGIDDRKLAGICRDLVADAMIARRSWPSRQHDHAGARFSLQLLDVYGLPAELQG